MAEHDEPELDATPLRLSHDDEGQATRAGADDAVRSLMAAVANDIAVAVAPLRDEIDALKAQHAAEIATFTERLTQQDGWIAELASRLRQIERDARAKQE
jgi:hypothetical protein